MIGADSGQENSIPFDAVTSQGTVLVTGCAGHVGSHTVRALRRAGHDVVVSTRSILDVARR